MNKESLARSICQNLQGQGYTAYYAGGYVRDKILGIPSDDIDIATDAAPETIQSLFPKTIPLGIAFGIVMVVEKGHNFEVATFRKDLKYKDGRRPQEIAFCSPKEDALRRDFTINGMFYDPLHEKIYDYVGGEEDLKEKVIRAIGDPFIRFEEDKLRMIRACRFAARFKFKIDAHTKQAILAEASSLFPSVSIERITQELKKMANHDFAEALRLLHEFGLLSQIFPTLRDLSLEELERYLKSFEHLPDHAPMILYLLELFPNYSEEKLTETLDFLKLSNQEHELAHFIHKSRKKLEEGTKHDWVEFLAHPHAELGQKVIPARFSDSKRKHFLNESQKKEEELKAHIERKKNNKPLVTSDQLMRYGIAAGKKLGDLLRLAEQIVIDEDLDCPEDTIKRLQQHPLWNA